MARILSVLTVLFFLGITTYGQIWQESFTGLADGTTSDAGATAWTTTYSGSGTFSVQGGLFQANSTASEGVWTSQSINISAFGIAKIDIDVLTVFNGTGDYIRCFYRVDGGPEIQFFEQLGGFAAAPTAGSAIVSGSAIQIVLRIFNDGSFFGLDTYTIDNVTVTGIQTLYSRANNVAWNAVGTWSNVGLGGASCGCTPTIDSRVIIR
jgi:trimeric autotransporter adhesin